MTIFDQERLKAAVRKQCQVFYIYTNTDTPTIEQWQEVVSAMKELDDIRKEIELWR